jgi:hypothetical protein
MLFDFDDQLLSREYVNIVIIVLLIYFLCVLSHFKFQIKGSYKRGVFFFINHQVLIASKKTI